jgi:hypothetical protein
VGSRSELFFGNTIATHLHSAGLGHPRACQPFIPGKESNVMNYRAVIMVVFLVLGILGSCAGSGLAFDGLWTTIGSTGMPDDASRNSVRFTGSTVEAKPAFTGTLFVRYNVDEKDLDGFPALVQIRYRDNGSAARVIVTLKEHNFTTGEVTNIAVFDSNKAAPSPDFQTGLALSCDSTSSHPFDFLNNAYYIEIELRKSRAGGNPGVSQIRISNALC